MMLDFMNKFATAFAAGVLIGVLVMAAVWEVAIGGDVIEVGDNHYVGIEFGDLEGWFEFDPDQPVTFIKVVYE